MTPTHREFGFDSQRQWHFSTKGLSEWSTSSPPESIPHVLGLKLGGMGDYTTCSPKKLPHSSWPRGSHLVLIPVSSIWINHSILQAPPPTMGGEQRASAARVQPGCGPHVRSSHQLHPNADHASGPASQPCTPEGQRAGSPSRCLGGGFTGSPLLCPRASFRTERGWDCRSQQTLLLAKALTPVLPRTLQRPSSGNRRQKPPTPPRPQSGVSRSTGNGFEMQGRLVSVYGGSGGRRGTWLGRRAEAGVWEAHRGQRWGRQQLPTRSEDVV